MKRSRYLICLTMLGSLSFAVAGCDAFVIPGALLKVANCEIGELTATEIRVLSEAAADLINEQDPSANATGLTQEQAQAIVNFLAANNVKTCEDLENLFEQDLESIQGLEELAAAFQDTDDLRDIFSFL